MLARVAAMLRKSYGAGGKGGKGGEPFMRGLEEYYSDSLGQIGRSEAPKKVNAEFSHAEKSIFKGEWGWL